MTRTNVSKHQHNWNLQRELFEYVGDMGAQIHWGYRYFCTKCLKIKKVKSVKEKK